jgi:peptide/nickel transport system ATP-binding protein
LQIARGRILGVIGESGSGKSTLARVIAGLHPPQAGRMRLDGIALAPQALQRSPKERRRIQLVFQMADTALNTKHSVGRILGRVLRFYTDMHEASRQARIAELLAMVKLPADYAARRPEQLSGGEKQRVNLARALAAAPDVLICDEITSALDTIVARHIVALIDELRERLGLAVMLISHDLATVASLADEVMVLRHGRVVEFGPTEQVLAHPKHEYTKLLARSVPELRVGWLEEAGL